MTQQSVELRSDTFTRPTPAMRRAMFEAEVGDDVWNEDPTVHRLEAMAAELLGKEAGLFVASGTQGNLVSILAHTRRGDEIIVGDRSHIFAHECAGASVVGALQTRTLPNGNGRLSAEAVRKAIRPDDVHAPRTGLVAIENTHNGCGGTVLTVDDERRVADVAHAAGIPVHLDGARIFNAAAALDIPAADLAAPADSVTFCLSKGLGAPVGSVVCGSEAFIAEVKRWRKLLGGGMRQVGVLAAAGIVALRDNRERLRDDHEHARRLAEALSHIPGIIVDCDRVQSNMVFFDATGTGMSNREFVECLAEHGVRVAEAGDEIRAVLSYEVTGDDVEYAITAARDVAASLARA